MDYYILTGKEITPVSDVLTWGRWFEKANRHVGLDTIDGVRISTVFLGLDHSFRINSEKPVLFETMIFEHKKFEDFQRRYCSYEEAEKGHKKACELVRRYLKKVKS